jgi:hypothetical protein
MSDDLPRPPANRERAISRETATDDLAEGLENESLTPRQMESVQLIEDEYGREAIAEFRETGQWPEGVDIENSHMPSIEAEPELATHPGDLVPQDFHRYGVHGGDTNEPLEMDPLDPDYAGQSGYQILDEDGNAIGQTGTAEVEDSGLDLGELGSVDTEAVAADAGADAAGGALAGGTEGAVTAGAAETTAAVGAEAAAGDGLAAGLTAVGEGILAGEAAGGAEVEAATGPVGWVVGGAALLVAGAAIGAGYLLGDDSSTAQSTTTAEPSPETEVPDDASNQAEYEG